MARLQIVVDVSVDPTLEDPHDVSAEILMQDFCDEPVEFVSAEWVD